MAVPLALALPVLFGFAMLAIDGGRYFNLHTSTQAGADALALAGAAELDGRPDAINRANRAVATLVQNDPRFGQDGASIVAAELRFMRALPPRDGDPITADYVTTDPTEARFIEVSARPSGFRSLFSGAAQATGGPTQATPSQAVAGFESIACKVSPLFICNPFERSGTNLFTAMRDPANRRRLIAMKEKDTKYFPGNFGYLQPAVGSGASDVRDAMGMAEPRGCYKQSGVELRTGAISSTAEAMNTRFDLYENSMNNAENDPSFRPALNVRKGYKYKMTNNKITNGCNATLAYDPHLSPADNLMPANNPDGVLESIGLPRDDCFYQNNCSFGGAAMAGRVGDGKWDFDRYWQIVYGTKPKPNGWSNANLPTRYELYRYEIESGIYKETSVGVANTSTSIEIGAPQCTAPPPKPEEETVDRRIFYGAILDCQALDDKYGINGGSPPPLPVSAFGKFFITEPVDKNDGTVFVELVDIVEPGTSGAKGIIHDIVKLHR